MKLEEIMEGVVGRPYSTRERYMDHLYGDWWKTKKGGVRKNLAKDCPYTLKEIHDVYFSCPSVFQWNIFEQPSPAMSVWKVDSHDGVFYCDDTVWNVKFALKKDGWLHTPFDIVAVWDGNNYTLLKKQEVVSFIQREKVKPVMLHEKFVAGDCDNGRFWDVSLSFPIPVDRIPDSFVFN